MKHLILALLLLCNVVAFSQTSGNGGQANENEYVKIDYAGNLLGRVTNKQACDIDIKISVDGGNQWTVTVPAGGTVTFPVTLGTRVVAKPLFNCDHSNGDLGQVELKFTASVLPIKAGSLKVAQAMNPTNGSVLKNTFKISFEVYDAVPNHSYLLQLSLDGKTYQTIAVQFTDEVNPNRTYSMTVQLFPGLTTAKVISYN